MAVDVEGRVGVTRAASAVVDRAFGRDGGDGGQGAPVLVTLGVMAVTTLLRVP